jgi:hypothetical protein
LLIAPDSPRRSNATAAAVLTSFIQPSHTGVPMNAGLALAFLIFCLLASSPGSAQGLCAECLKAAQEELRTCLDNAISVDDKNTCEENRKEGMKACENKECTAEREAKELQKEKPSGNR